MSSRAVEEVAPAVTRALLSSTRALLRVEDEHDVVAAATDLVEALGGWVSDDCAAPDALPVDLAFGSGRPLVPCAEPGTVSRMLLERHLPEFVEDAERAIGLRRGLRHLSDEATLDPLTGLANRRATGRALGTIRAGDSVAIIDLDHFKKLNDTRGHEEGDLVLREFADVLGVAASPRNHVGRQGGEEFLVILRRGDVTPEEFFALLEQLWRVRRTHPVTFSAGVAVVGPDPASDVTAADRALYRAKAEGRDQVRWATEDDRP